MKNRKAVIQMIVGAGIAGACLYFFFRNTDPKQLLAAMKQAHYIWLLPAFLLTLASLMFRVWRWRYLLYEVKRISLRGLWTPMILGFMGNTLLPARAGEAIRVVALSQREQVPFTTTLASLVMDRMFDMLAVVLVIMFVFGVLPLDVSAIEQYSDQFPFTVEGIRHSVGVVMGGGLLVGIAMLLFLYHQRERTERVLRRVLFFLPHGFRDRLIGMLETFTDGMHVFRSPRHIIYCLMHTVGVWVTIAATFVMFIYAFDLQGYLDWRAPIILLACASLAVMIPTPGFLGSYQIGMAVGLALANGAIARDTAGVVEAFGIVTWIATFIPVVLLGLLTLAMEGVSLGAFQRDATADGQAQEAGPP